MNNEPKLVKFLRSLDKDELDDVSRFVVYKQGNDNHCYAVFIFLKKQCSKNSNVLDAAYILKNVLPNSSLKSVSNYISLLKNICEEWLAYQVLKNDQYKLKAFVLEGYLQRELFEIADQHINKIKEDIESNEGLCIEKKLLEASMYHHLYNSSHPFKNQMKGMAMHKVIESYFEFVILQLLIYRVELKNWEKINSVDYSFWYILIDGITKSSNHKTHQFLKELGNLHNESTVAKLNQLDDIFANGVIDKKSKFYIDGLDYLRIVGVRLFRKKQLNDSNFILSKYMQRLQYMEAYGIRMGSQILINITSQMSIVYPYDYIRDFIEKWIKLIHPKEKNVTLLRCYAANCLYHDRYDELTNYILGKDFKIIDDKIEIAILTMIAVFMQNDMERAQLKCKNFKYLIKRNYGIIGENKFKRYENFIRFYEYLLKREYIIAEKCLDSEIAYRIWCNKILEKQKD